MFLTYQNSPPYWCVGRVFFWDNSFFPPLTMHSPDENLALVFTPKVKEGGFNHDFPVVYQVWDAVFFWI